MARKGLSRKREFRTKRNARKTYLVWVDGETEIWYLQMMKANESLPGINIKPDIPNPKKLKQQIESIKSLKDDYDKIIWVLDFDTINKEDRERKPGDQSPIFYLKEFLDSIETDEKIDVLINNPCLEFWFLLHFEGTGKYFSNCEDSRKVLKRNHLIDYSKSVKYFQKKHNDIYTKLRPLLKDAIANSEKLGKFDCSTPNQAKAEMHKLFEIFNLNID